MVTAKKLPDGLMYLVETNPHETPDGEGVYIDEIPEWDDFDKAHPPILALFKCTEGQRFEDGEVELVWQYENAQLGWITESNDDHDMAVVLGFNTRQVYTLKSEPMTPDEIKYQGLSMANNNWNYISKLIYDGWQVGSHRKTYSAVRALPTHTLKSDKGGEKLTNEVLERYGFSKIPHYTVTDSVVLDIGRNRYLSAGCVGTPNEMLWLGYNTHIDKPPTDLICLHNFDYDGKLTIERLELILKALNPPQP